MTVMTQTMSRQLAGELQGNYLVATVPARDPLLDAMTFTRGRFAVLTSGMPMLSIPSWAEVGKVIEDCR